ncbi:asparagine synthase (glutamine-hydrolyzing) [Methanobacterium formicicum]|uniref:asparagine synthase (glutamine-hydrolyzing) n=1 Tax=Methanobacterium formicicum TaxID=2162 RepID=UPI0024124BA5|nr:asparagine synthase (glutamine-hydrolyzing) [Methanobacterium formicicum]MDG3547067.1 asparagine synthase (glutamine-hydrolyzing) [Methanobacterium formicicum]
MSSITGIYYRDGRFVDYNQIKKINDILCHRGPDGSGIEVNGSVAFGHQMLYTTVESIGEKLPFQDNSSEMMITSDARIDNRLELSEELNIENNVKIPDSLFILRAYQKWGENCPERLLGDYAFAIWDGNEETLFCARDYIGVKPFYYHLSENGFFFSTEIKALLLIPEISSKINELKAAFHLMEISGERRLTFYQDILRLPAGHSLKIDSDKIKIKKYWNLDPKLELKLDNEEYVQRFREIFTEAVRCRLRTPFRIGFELSGGIDSSSLVCTAKNILNSTTDYPILTFSHSFKELPECDETHYIKKVINMGGIKPVYLRSGQISPFDKVEEILKFQDEPYTNPNISLFWNLYKKMNENSVRVSLSGNDGDGVLSRGHNHLKELAVNFRFNDLIKEVNGFSKIHDKDPFSVFMQKVLFPLVPEFFKEIIRSTHPEIRIGDFVLDNKELSERLDLEKHYHDYHWTNRPTKSKEYHYYLLSSGNHQTTLEVLDRCTGAFYIEPRYPFYDRRLLEFCYSLPTEQKFSEGWDRYVMRHALSGILPSEIQWRSSKASFSPVLEKNLLQFEEKLLNNLIYHDNNRISDFVNMKSVKASYQRYQSKTQEYDPLGDPRNIEKFALLTIWLEQNNKYLYKQKECKNI